MANDLYGTDDAENTLGDFLELRLQTAAERPSFFTEERIQELLPNDPTQPDPLDFELARQAANRRFSQTITREAFDRLGPNYCGLFPESAICIAPPPATGEARVSRPGRPRAPDAAAIEIRPAERIPPPRAPQAVDAFDALRSRFAEEALLRGRQPLDIGEAGRREEAERLATAAREGRQRAEEEEFFRLTPTERFRAGVTLRPGGGIQSAVRFRVPT